MVSIVKSYDAQNEMPDDAEHSQKCKLTSENAIKEW